MLVSILLLAPVARAAEPDGLKLPPGFHAEVVADGLAGARHIAVRPNGDIYVSTNTARGKAPVGIYALRPDADHTAKAVTFSTVTGGTGIRFHDGALYAASGTTIWRFDLDGEALVPAAPPQLVVAGMPDENGRNRIISFDGEGNLYVALSGTGNNVCAIGGSRGKMGMQPCPELKDRAGIWRFPAGKMGQKFSEGELFATGNRNLPALEWAPGQGRNNPGALYGVFHERDFTHELWPDFASEADDNAIGEGLYRITRGTDFGWPYSYYDGVRNIRLVAPEYGGDGKKIAPPGKYAAPVFNFVSPKGRGAPTDMVLSAAGWPAAWRNGFLFGRHGGLGADRPGGYAGYDIVFLPMGADGKPGSLKTFADGFAGASDDDRTQRRSTYRPVGMGLGPDGALYVVDSTKGRLWRISYSGR